MLHETKPIGSWIFKNVPTSKLKCLKFERTKLKPSLKEPSHKFYNVKTSTIDSFNKEKPCNTSTYYLSTCKDKLAR
jgi:hypothetical protein